MSKVSFIHCSDLHLGCQQFNEPRRFEDFMESFSGIIDNALEKHVDYVLLSGDLFHHRNVNAHTLSLVMGLLDRLRSAGIQVVAIEGNHDKAFYLDEDSWMGFLNNQGYIKLLKPSFQEGRLQITPYDGEKGCVIETGDIRIIGLGYLGATTRQRLDEAAAIIGESERFTVVMLHAAVDKLLGQDMAGVGKDSFLAFKGKVDYFALGHIHSRQEHLDFIFNPGAPESVHMDEVRKSQEKGFYHVTAEGGEKCVEFIKSSRRPICYFDMDITGIPSPALIPERVFSSIDASDIRSFCQPLVQVNIFGTVDFNSFAIDAGGIADSLKNRYDCLAVEVLNNANLVQISENAEGRDFDRSLVERSVISRMVREERPEFRDIVGDITDLVLMTKNNSLSGVDEDEIISAIGVFLGKIPLSEAAASGEEEKTDENQAG